MPQNNDEREIGVHRQAKGPGDIETRLRVWPAAIIALAHLIAAWAFSYFGSTNIHSAIALGGVPLVSSLLLIVWWLAASRAPRKDRWIGLALFLAAVAAVVFSQKTVSMGGMLVALALPVMVLGTVAALLVTYRMRWPARRWVLMAVLVICAVLFCAKRVDSIGGDLAPVVSWRWNPTIEDRSTMIPAEEAHGTANLPATAGPSDWPEFRGTARDGRVLGASFSTDWATPPREVWRRKIGAGWSSFSAVGDYLFTQEQRGKQELVTCYRADTGELVWQNEVDARYEDAMGLGPRATPTFADGRLYALGGTGMLQCLDATTGKRIWMRDLKKDAETKLPGWGYASSPLVVGEMVIEFSGAGDDRSVISYNRNTGDVIWRAGRGGGGYSSPHLAVLAGTPQVLMVSDSGVQSLSLETGALLWDQAWKIDTNPRCTQPLIVDNNTVMYGGTGSAGSALLQVEKKADAWTVNELWRTKKFRPYFNDGALHKGHFYGLDGERLACIDIKTGERVWQGKMYGGQLLLFPDMDMLLILSEKGELILVPAVPDGFSEKAKLKVLTGKTWNHPVTAYGKLFVRNSEEAVCYELPAS